MKKDYKKILKSLYLPKVNVPTVVSVPKLNYLMVSGLGRPEDESFQLAAKTLFPVAYLDKFTLKSENPEEDFTVMPMEVKWRLDRSQRGSQRYFWTMMIMQPESITERILEKAIDTLNNKKVVLPFKDRLRLQPYREDLCGQILHVGPYGGAMDSTFELLKRMLAAQGYCWEPDSHDVYFNDSRKTSPDKLKTLMRVRIWKKGAALPMLDDPFLQW